MGYQGSGFNSVYSEYRHRSGSECIVDIFINISKKNSFVDRVSGFFLG